MTVRAVLTCDINQAEVGKHLAAMLNSGEGGQILIGVVPATGELVGVRNMDRKNRDLFRQGFDYYLGGKYIKPKVHTDAVELKFHPLEQKFESVAEDNNIHVSIERYNCL